VARRAVHALIAAMFGAALLHPAERLEAQQRVSFPTSDGGLIQADLYGGGDRAVVLAHGGRFNKESWKEQAGTLADAGFRVLAIDFRGYGESRGPGDTDVMSAPLDLDVLAAVHWLRTSGAKTVYAVGASLGGGACAEAAVAEPGTIERLVLLGSQAGDSPEQLTGRKLFLLTRDDADGSGTRRLPRIQAQYERTPEPKEMILLEGDAHAQFIFLSPEGPRAMRGILGFLTTP
jgi:pimeloyl-ACP methyl ester carboxylesterase